MSISGLFTIDMYVLSKSSQITLFIFNTVGINDLLNYQVNNKKENG